MNGMKFLKIMSKRIFLWFALGGSFLVVGCGEDNSVKMSVETSYNVVSLEENHHENETGDIEKEKKEVSADYILPNWNQCEDEMDEEDKKDFREFLGVLNNEESFFCFHWGGDKERTFNDYLSSIESRKKTDIEEIALVDLDNQNGKELILEIYEGGGNYLILTRDKGKFYGTNMGDRCFEELQKDGKYIGSGGAITAYYRTMKIDSNGVEEYQFGERKEEKRDGGYFGKLIVNGKYIENCDKWFEENYSDPVDWIQ